MTGGNGRGAGGNIRMQLPYDDLRGWLAEAERLGEVAHVKGASWQEDIGLATELVSTTTSTPALLFDEVPGLRERLPRAVEFLRRQAQAHDARLSHRLTRSS